MEVKKWPNLLAASSQFKLLHHFPFSEFPSRVKPSTWPNAKDPAKHSQLFETREGKRKRTAPRELTKEKLDEEKERGRVEQRASIKYQVYSICVFENGLILVATHVPTCHSALIYKR